MITDSIAPDIATMDDRQRFHDTIDTALPAPYRHWAGSRRPLWEFLMALAATDLPLARLVEAHTDATGILAELGAAPAHSGQYWAVWAAEPPDGVVTASIDGGQWVLSGTKRWCSGPHLCTHALISAHAPDGRRLFAVDLAQPGIRVHDGEWAAPGMLRADTTSVGMTEVAGTPVGGPGEYLERPGFWHGAIGVAACWHGGAIGVAARLAKAGRDGRLDEHGLAHLGAVDSALHAARCVVLASADEIDADPIDDAVSGRIRALRARAIVEHAVRTTVDRAGRALGPGPLAHDAEHIQRVADLTVYVRQSHAERDLAALGLALGSVPGSVPGQGR